MELKPNPTYLFVLLPTDCFLDNSSAAWIGLQNIWPLFLTIFCFIAVSWVHSFTNLRIWHRTQLSTPRQTLHRANYSKTVPWIRAFHTVETAPTIRDGAFRELFKPSPLHLWNPLSSCFTQQLVESVRHLSYKFKFQPCWRTYKKNQFCSQLMVFSLENQILG